VVDELLGMVFVGAVLLETGVVGAVLLLIGIGSRELLLGAVLIGEIITV